MLTGAKLPTRVLDGRTHSRLQICYSARHPRASIDDEESDRV